MTDLYHELLSIYDRNIMRQIEEGCAAHGRLLLKHGDPNAQHFLDVAAALSNLYRPQAEKLVFVLTRS